MPVSTDAAQPIFDEMPRWSGGWGVQFIYEHRRESALLDPDGAPADRYGERIDLLHIEGVYTFERWIRVTAKVPVVLDASRTLPDGVGGTLRQTDRGLGDPTLAVPLKRYFNLDGRSGSWTFAPQVRLGLSTRDAYPVFGDGWGGGATAGWETETYRYHLGASVTGWVFPGWGLDRDAAGLGRADLAAGINVHGLGTSGHLKIKVGLIAGSRGERRVVIGPVFYWKFTDLVHGQLVWRHDLYDAVGVPDHGDGDAFRVGVGFVF